MFKVIIPASHACVIANCPENGLKSIDFRLANGLPAAPYNRCDLPGIEYTDESLCRQFKDLTNRRGDLDASEITIPIRGEARDQEYAHQCVKVTPYIRRGECDCRKIVPFNGKYGMDSQAIAIPAQILAPLVANPGPDTVAPLFQFLADELAIRNGKDAQLIEELAAKRAAEEKARLEEKRAAEERAAKLKEAKMLLADELEELTEVRGKWQSVSCFLAEVPKDALRGTMKKMSEESKKSIESIEKELEEDSYCAIFDEDDADDDE